MKELHIGDTIGRWTIIGGPKRGTHGKTMWLCRCSCSDATERWILDASLNKNGSSSCGCRQREESKRWGNRIEIDGDIAKIYSNKTEDFFVVDTDDVEMLSGWTCLKYKGHWYVSIGGNRTIAVPNFVLGLPSSQIVDHIDRNPDNNRRNNWRPCSQRENTFNRGIKHNSKSGVIGVRYNGKGKKPWLAMITKDRIIRLMKQFENFDDAVKARLEAEAEYFGEFAPQRDLFEKYGGSYRIKT